jgi:alpha-tubulin suppressor-like RCC1 family protein
MALILAAITATLMMATTAPAGAHVPYTATAWGRNTSGQLGDGTTVGPEKCEGTEACSASPVAVSALNGVTAVAAGGGHSLALLENGTVWAWGANGSGQLGNGTTTGSDVPVAVSELKGVTAIAAGGTHSLALLSNGTVVAWGNNSFGQLGNGTTKESNVPVAVSGLEKVKAISAGNSFSEAMLENGTVMAWGDNQEGQLGNGTKESSHVPVAVSKLTGVTAISAGGNHSLALLGASGKVMAWGENSFGELGNGKTEASAVPVAVVGLSERVNTIAAGGEHSLALLSNTTVVAWGENNDGQLGNGSHTGPESCGKSLIPCSTTPVAVSKLSGVTAVAGGGEHTLALLKSGSVMAWGRNLNGQLGVGTSAGPEVCSAHANPCSTTPVPVSTHGTAAGVSAGAEHSLAFGPPPPPPTNLPEVGRCVKVTTQKGVYKYGNCIVESPEHNGSFEWMPGPGAKPKFVSEISATTFEGVGKEVQIVCGSGKLDGAYTAAKAATATLEFRDCSNVNTKQSCQTSPAHAGEIHSEEGAIEGELGFIRSGEVPRVGLDLKPKSPSKALLSFACGGPPEFSGEAWSIEGSVIGEINPTNGMKPAFRLVYAQVAGYQAPERFEGGLKDTLIASRVAGPGQPLADQTGLGTTGAEHRYFEIKNEEPLEIKAKP